MAIENGAEKIKAKTGSKEHEESFMRHNKEKRPAQFVLRAQSLAQPPRVP